jgi:uncharacterized protein YoxC
MLSDADIEKIADAVFNRICDDLHEMRNSVSSVSSSCNAIVDSVSHRLSEIKSTVNGLSGQMYSIQSRLDSMRR